LDPPHDKGNDFNLGNIKEPKRTQKKNKFECTLSDKYWGTPLVEKRASKTTEVKGFVYTNDGNNKSTKKTKITSENNKAYYAGQTLTSENILMGTLVSAPEHDVYIPGKGTLRFFPDCGDITQQFEVIDDSSEDNYKK
jgi:hypothetical protein